jgi:alpha-tubulin suppressor-like RCC1 family protein
MSRYLIIIESTGTGFSAYSPDLPGCVATGRTRPEVEHEMHDASSFILRACGWVANRFKSRVLMLRITKWRPNQSRQPAPVKHQACTRGSFPSFIAAVFLAAAYSLYGQTPWAATQPAGPVKPSSATINGMAVPRGLATSAWFEWGSDSKYSQATSSIDIGSGGKAVRISATLNGLAPGAYHFRLVTLNSLGVAYGADHQFTTGAKISTWGDYIYGRLPLPAGLTNVVAIASGHTHGLALRNDGTVAAWMSYMASNVGQTNVPTALSNVVAVAGGWVHSLALHENGTVAAWGRWFDNGNDIEGVSVPFGLTNVVAIAGGDEHDVALRSDGSVVVWGVNGHGQLNVPANVTNIVAISAGSTHTLALRADGTVVAWGSSVGGDMTPPAGLARVVAISTEGWHNLALRSDGTVAAWGSAQFGQTAIPPGLMNVVQIADGFEHSLALKNDGTLVAWGISGYVTNLPPTSINPISIATGDFQSLAISSVDLTPIAFPVHATGLTNQDLVLSPAGWDPNGDTLKFRNVSLPLNGTLYQFTPGGRGARIADTNTIITDPSGKIIFAPVPDFFGVPYATFSYVSDDGQNESTPVLMTVNIIPRPFIDSTVFTNSGFVLNFSGIPNITYQVLGSFDLITWVALGYASQPSPGQFQYLDTSAHNIPSRCYRINVIEP